MGQDLASCFWQLYLPLTLDPPIQQEDGEMMEIFNEPALLTSH